MNDLPARGPKKGHIEAVVWAIRSTACRRGAGRVLLLSAGLGTLESCSVTIYSSPSAGWLPVPPSPGHVAYRVESTPLTQRGSPTSPPDPSPPIPSSPGSVFLLYFCLGPARPSSLRQILLHQSSSSKYIQNRALNPPPLLQPWASLWSPLTSSPKLTAPFSLCTPSALSA